MKKDLVEMVFILDRSGSMAGLEKDTIGGFNSLIEKQKKLKGDALVNTVLFSDYFQVLHNRRSIKYISKLTELDYSVGGSTALLDAIGRSVIKIQDIHQKIGEDQVPEKTMFIIITDGMENASRQYTYDMIKVMITTLQKSLGWEFLFMGANMDAIATASQLGIQASRASNYYADGQGTKATYNAMHRAVNDLRVNKILSPDWKEEVEADFAARHKKKK
jgi:Mg-chelatase subunit ChlD